MVAGAISAAACLLPLFLVQNYIIILVAGVIEMLVLYPIIVGVIGAVGKEDLELLKNLTNSIPVVGNFIRFFTNYSEHFVRS